MCDLHDHSHGLEKGDVLMDTEFSLEQNFYGAATVGERGQVVIPADARKKYGIHPGDKVLVMGHPGHAGIMLCKIDSIRDVFSSLLDELRKIESTVAETEEHRSNA